MQLISTVWNIPTPVLVFSLHFLDLAISGLVSYVTGKLWVTILERSGKFSQSYDHSCSKSMSGCCSHYPA